MDKTTVLMLTVGVILVLGVLCYALVPTGNQPTHITRRECVAQKTPVADAQGTQSAQTVAVEKQVVETDPSDKETELYDKLGALFGIELGVEMKDAKTDEANRVVIEPIAGKGLKWLHDYKCCVVGPEKKVCSISGRSSSDSIELFLDGCKMLELKYGAKLEMKRALNGAMTSGRIFARKGGRIRYILITRTSLAMGFVSIKLADAQLEEQYEKELAARENDKLKKMADGL